MNPLITVLMPVHNGELFLTAAIESILHQSYSHWELLVLDDGSTDRSLEISEAIAAADPRVRVVPGEKSGIVRTLNAGLERARGSFVARMDADDVSLPRRFERQLAFLRAHPEVVATGTHALLVDSDGDPICPWFVQLVDHEAIERRLLSGEGGGTIVHPTVMFRKQHLDAVAGYRIEYECAEDLDLFLRLSERGRLANLPEVLLRYRQHLRSVGVTRRAQERDAARRALEDAWRRRGLSGHPPEVSAGSEVPAIKYRLDWAWLALTAGNVATARKHAREAVRTAPTRIDAWRALACSIRGH